MERKGKPKAWVKQYQRRCKTVRTIEKHQPGALVLCESENGMETAILCLIGISTGGIGHIPYQTLHGIVKELAGFVRLVMPFAKPYSLVQFKTMNDAKRARDVLNGQPCPDLDGRILWVEFWAHPMDDASQAEEEREFREGESPPGWRIILQVLTEEEERILMERLISPVYSDARGLEWSWNRVNGRDVCHFGYAFDYSQTSLGHQAQPAIPDFLQEILDRLPRLLDPRNLDLSPPNQITINSYPPGLGIPPHTDDSSLGPMICSISLGSPVLMDLSLEDKGETQLKRVCVDLPARSLMIMEGKVRWEWKHGIRARKVDRLPDGELRPRGHRVSITLRWVNSSKLAGGSKEAGSGVDG